MSYAIQWDLLLADEVDFLQRAGVEMYPSGMSFKRPPSWEDFTLVFAYLHDLRNRTLEDGNHISLAIGDCLNAGAEFFGENRVDKWIKGFLQLCYMRDQILSMAGATLILLQLVERQIKSCCAVIPLKGLKLTLEDFLSPDPSRRRQTLGQLARALKHSDIFDPTFEDRLTKFVNSRNEFIHSLWVEPGRDCDTTSHLPSEEEFERIHNFITSLIREASHFSDVFQGFRCELTRAYIPEVVEHETSFLSRWARYVPEFREALRKAPKIDPEQGCPPGLPLER